MQTPINDFSEAQQEYVAHLLEQRYGTPVDLQLADSELQINPLDGELSVCPTLYWSERGAQFVVCKVGENSFRCQFFYSPAEQFGTGIDEYDDLEKCVVTLLQVQSDHERQAAELSSAATTLAAQDGKEYSEPLVI